MVHETQTADDRRAHLLTVACPVLAVLSLVLGALSVFLLYQLMTGLPALVLGFLCFRWVNQSDGRLRGRLPALAGMVLGGIGTILGVVMNLALVILPMREDANRVECEFNLGQIGMAVNAYHERQRPHQYPPAIVPNPALPADRPEQHFSWLAAILPDLAEQAGPAGTSRGTPLRVVKLRQAAEHLDPTKAWDAEENREAVRIGLPQFLCPSNPNRAAPRSPALTHYVGIAGKGPNAAALPATEADAGFFGYDRRLSRADLEGEDGRGTSHILMALETAHENGPWAQGGPATVRGLDPNQTPYTGLGRPFGGCHPGGFNALFADGSVMFFKDSFAPRTLEELALLRTARGEP
jgi:prepilin-type processing-associated H-X9-DG protein